MIASCRPEPEEFSSDYQREIVGRLGGEDVRLIMQNQLFWICELGSSLSPQQVDVLHPPYRWTVRQVFEHCANSERIFGARLLRASAMDPTPLSSWDENAYADRRFGLGTFTNLVAELGSLRQANALLLDRILPGCWEHRVSVDGQAISVRAIAWLAAAHVSHHFNIIEKRCGLVVQHAPTISS